MKPSATAKYQLACLFYLVLFSILVYFNMLAGSFHFDDQSLLGRAWISDIDHFHKEVRLESVGNRPILLLTYALNNTLNPNHVFGFHLVNLQLHVLDAILIFLILRRAQYYLRADPGLSGLPLLTACLFALHPLNTDTISYISSRSSALAAFFYLLTVYGFLSLFMPGRSRIFKAGLGFFCLLGFYLALASKLIAVTLPLALGIWFWLVVSNKSNLALRLPVARRGILFAVSLVFLSALFYLISAGWLLPRDQGVQIFGRGPYFLLQNKVIVFYYIKKFFLPVNLNVDVGFPFSTFWTDVQIPLAIAGIVAWIFYVFRWGNVYLKIATAWFFLTLSPTSSIVPLDDLAVEHHTYLPISLGLCLGLGWAVIQVSPARRQVFAAVLLLSLGFLTTARNAVWLDDLALWTDSAAKNPFSTRTLGNLGKAWYEKSEQYLARGETDLAKNAREQALACFKKALANLPQMGERFYNKKMFYEYFDQLATSDLKKQMRSDSNKDIKLLANFAAPHYNIASLYLDLGRFVEAEQEYLAAIAIDPDFFSAYLGMGSVYNQTGRYAEAIERYKAGMERKRAAGEADDPLFHLNLGEVYGKTGQNLEAIAELKRAIQLSPSLDKAYYNLGIVYTLLGEYDHAEQSYLAGLKLNSNFLEAQFNLAALYQMKREWDRSTQEFKKFMAIKGTDARAYFQIAWNHQQLEQWDEARSFYARALEIDPGFSKARANMDYISAMLGDRNNLD